MEAATDISTYRIRGAIFEVHRLLGPGLFEECYHQALMNELGLRGIAAQSKPKLPVRYKGVEIKAAYEPDIVVDNKIILELKSVPELRPEHHKQLINYLHLSNLYIGYLINFNTDSIVDQRDIFRLYNNKATDKTQW